MPIAFQRQWKRGDATAQMRTVFDPDARFVPVQTPVELTAVVTDFERQFNAEGIPTRRASYQRALDS